MTHFLLILAAVLSRTFQKKLLIFSVFLLIGILAVVMTVTPMSEANDGKLEVLKSVPANDECDDDECNPGDDE